MPEITIAGKRGQGNPIFGMPGCVNLELDHGDSVERIPLKIPTKITIGGENWPVAMEKIVVRKIAESDDKTVYMVRLTLLTQDFRLFVSDDIAECRDALEGRGNGGPAGEDEDEGGNGEGGGSEDEVG